MLAEQYSYGGLLNKLSNPVLKATLSFLLLDLVYYLWHKASHSFDCLWLFHRVHHNDPALNVSTAFRIHLVELLIATGLKAAYILALGVDAAWVLTYESLMILFVMFHHANISMPGEKWLGKLIIVPYLHQVHHSTQRHEHDSNYGAILTIWDRLFGTLKQVEPEEIGIKGHSPQTLIKLMKYGFADTTPAAAAPVPTRGIQSMIAEAAYYKAEKRGFFPGYELCDWLEAETEILRLVYQANAVKSARPVKKQIDLLDFLGFCFKRPILN
ncbi:MAG: sterol desaturase family protein [Gammaproteobacteria bacterium]